MPNENLGRDKLPWSDELWKRVDTAVHDEMNRTAVGRKIVTPIPMPDARFLPRPCDRQAQPIPKSSARHCLHSGQRPSSATLLSISVVFRLDRRP